MADPVVLDADGNLTTLGWLRYKYGPFTIHTPPPLEPGEESLVWRITALRERIDAPATIVVRTSHFDWSPMPGVKVAWHWPHAPVDLDCGPVGAPFEGVPAHSCVSRCSSADGYACLATGDGARYYADRGERGPYAVWIHGAETRSDLLLGLGMLAGTNYDHFDVEFSLVHDNGEEPEDPETEGLFARFGEIVEQLTRIACALEDARPALEDARPALEDARPDQEAPTHG